MFSLLPPAFPAVPRYFLQTFDLDTLPTSRSQPPNFRCVDAGFIPHTPPRLADFAGTCPLVPGVPHLVSGSCSSPHLFALGFLVSSVPCPAHTLGMNRALQRVGSMPVIGRLSYFQ